MPEWAQFIVAVLAVLASAGVLRLAFFPAARRRERAGADHEQAQADSERIEAAHSLAKLAYATAEEERKRRREQIAELEERRTRDSEKCDKAIQQLMDEVARCAHDLATDHEAALTEINALQQRVQQLETKANGKEAV